MRIAALVWSILVPLASALPLFAPAYHPIVLWHGLGDSAYAEGMVELANELREAYPGIYVHIVALGADAGSDQKAGFFGNVNDQVSTVCSDLSAVPELAEGFDAIGFSQGGQFLRAYVERCNVPQVRNLITFGSQHQGIADLPACKPGDFLCRLAEGALRGGVYSDYAQSSLVTAQYFRDSKTQETYQRYLEANHFLTDINNELEDSRNATYKTNMEKLDNFVMLMFNKDVTVEPKQSSWFAAYPVPKEDDQGVRTPHDKLEVLPLRQSEIYLEDRIGLKTLDKRGGLKMELCKGVHMQIDPACQMKVLGQYAGIAPPSKIVPASFRHAWARVLHVAITTTHSREVLAWLHMQLRLMGSALGWS